MLSYFLKNDLNLRPIIQFCQIKKDLIIGLFSSFIPIQKEFVATNESRSRKEAPDNDII